ncbi:MAG TPA: mechanosensitive ion channel domain-containing protein [Ignavibacteriaceae bacterium]|nr:mechanosensitive ion channel domain-containing protein [Ignavibacteriaceae bacterium]
MNLKEMLNQTYLGNTVALYLTALGIFLVTVIIIYFFKNILVKKLKQNAAKTDTKIDDYIIKGTERTLIPFLFFAAFYFSLNILTFHPKVQDKINIVFIIIATYFIIRTIVSVIRFSLHLYIVRKAGGESRQKQLNGIINLFSFLIWVLGFVFLLDNLGFKVSAVITGLGIGGIAIALAAQAILADLFSYFVIFFDRPFEIGDFIVVGDKSGSVESIGIKTTRLRSLTGEQLVVANTDLTNSRVHNYKRMERRRIQFSFKVDPNTQVDKLNSIPLIVRTVIEQNEKIATFDRSHFSSFTDYGFMFESVYYVESADYNIYMNIQQKINLQLTEEFNQQGIKFAFLKMPV